MRLIAILATILAGSTTALAQADRPSVVVVVGKGKGAPNLTKPVKRFIEKPLKDSFEVIPFKKFKRAAKKARVNKRKWVTPAGATKVGERLSATHVIVVESEKRGRRRKKAFFANVTVFEVASGEAIYNEEIKLKGKKLTGGLVGPLLQTLNEKIQVAAPAPETLSEEAVEEEPPPPPPPPEDQPTAQTDETMTEAAQEEVAQDAMVAEEPTQVDSSESEGEVAMAEEETATVTETASESAPAASGKAGPAVILDIGAIAMRRDAELTASGSEPPSYEGPRPGLRLAFDAYPLALGGSGGLIEGIGVHGEVEVYRAQTEVGDPVEKIDSDVLDLGGGLSFRIPFGAASTGPSVVVKGGYRYFHFPLKTGAFPGAKYSGIYAGVEGYIPVAGLLEVILGGRVTPQVTLDGKVGNQLGEKDSALSFRGQGGVRVPLGAFHVTALGRFEQLNAKFTGTTSIPAASITGQYDNVELTDRSFGGFIGAGMTF